MNAARLHGAPTYGVAIACTVRDGRIARFVTHEDLAPAIGAAGLTQADELAET
jgi:hypothetical protein